MPTTEFVSSTDKATQLRVSDFIKEPTTVQSVVTKMMTKQFIADALLRQAPNAAGGAVKFHEDEGLFAEGIEIVAEYGEIPVVKGADGTPRAVFTRKGGGALLISREMRTRNSIDLVNKRLRQIKNAMVKFWDDAFFQAILTNASIPTTAVPLAWTDAAAKVRFDLSGAKSGIMGQVDASGNEFGFEADTLVVHPLRAEALTYNDDVAKVFRGNIANLAPLYKGDLGVELSNLRIIKSFRMPVNKAIVLERKTVGFIADEYPLETTPLYEERPRQSWRADTTRSSAVGIDAPKAAHILTGV